MNEVISLRTKLKRSRLANILNVIREGWKYAIQTSTFDEGTNEIEMNARLFDGMCDSVGQTGRPWARKLTILEGVHTRSIGASIPDGVPDISIHMQDLRERLGEHSPHVVIECKRVAENRTDLCTLYVNEGIDRFKNEKYASNHSEGFMVGYVISGTAAGARSCVNSCLTKKARASEQLSASTIFGWVYTSHHSRTGSQTQITLYHAMLNL